MVDQIATAAVLGVVFVAAVYAHFQRLSRVSQPLWHVVAGSIPALVVVHAVGEAHVGPQPVLGVVSLSGGVLLLSAFTVPLSILTFSNPRTESSAQ